MKDMIAFALSLLLIAPVYAQDAGQFGVKQLLAEPSLVINSEPALCKEALQVAKDAFASSKPDYDIAGAIANKFAPLSWEPISDPTGEYATSQFRRLDLDLEGNGSKQVVIYRSGEHSWRGDWNYAYVFQSNAAFDSAKSQVFSAWRELPDMQYPPARRSEFGERQFYPSAISEDNKDRGTGNVWASPAIFSWNNRFYFVFGSTEFDRLSNRTVVLYRLRGNGAVSETCSIEVKGEEEAKRKFLATPAVSGLLKVIRRIGAGGEDCGTLHAGYRHDMQAVAAEARAASRPWAVSIAQDSRESGRSYYVFDERAKKYLEYWSRSDIWTRREYQTFLEHIDPAELGVKRFLIAEYGLEPIKAKSEAVRVVEELIGARFILPSGFDDSEEARELYFGNTLLRDAVTKRDADALDSLLKKPETIKVSVYSYGPALPVKEALSIALLNSVEWQYGLNKLIAAGADPNYSNKYGKTPLMVAAHLNRSDSIRVLLRAGADINAVTHRVNESCTDIGRMERVGRSALIYAAENANPIVIRQLLEAGSASSIRDSKGNGVDYYLELNPRLTSEERASGVIAIAKTADQFAGPSFNCKDARTAVEKVICQSEVLSQFDFEMARAYTLLRSKLGAGIVDEQKQWMKRRNTACGIVNETEDCLAEIMRTRVRYLHNRLGES
jgi:uncharacterized protein YecT (DUF1311 family)